MTQQRKPAGASNSTGGQFAGHDHSAPSAELRPVDLHDATMEAWAGIDAHSRLARDRCGQLLTMMGAEYAEVYRSGNRLQVTAAYNSSGDILNSAGREDFEALRNAIADVYADSVDEGAWKAVPVSDGADVHSIDNELAASAEHAWGQVKSLYSRVETGLREVLSERHPQVCSIDIVSLPNAECPAILRAHDMSGEEVELPVETLDEVGDLLGRLPNETAWFTASESNRLHTLRC